MTKNFSVMGSVVLMLSSAVALAGDFPACTTVAFNGLDWNALNPDVQSSLLKCNQTMMDQFMPILNRVVLEDFQLSTLNVSLVPACSQAIVMPPDALGLQASFDYAGVLVATNASGSTVLNLSESVYWTTSVATHDVMIGEVRDNLGNIVTAGVPGTELDQSVSEDLYFDLTNAVTGALLLDHGNLNIKLIERVGTPGEIKGWESAMHCNVVLPPVQIPNPPQDAL